MFADDTTLSSAGKTSTEVRDTLQSQLNVTKAWCDKNSMIPNPQKTKIMYISALNRRNINTNNIDNTNIFLNNQELNQSDNEKLLGVQVDNNLNWKCQINNILKKCNSLLHLLLRIKYCLNLDSRKLFFNAYILPHLDYCCTIWGSCSLELQNKILKFQKRAARIILDKPFDTPSKELFVQLNWMPFADRVIYKKSILMYKSLNKAVPDYLSDKFKKCPNSARRSAANELLEVPKPNLEFFRKCISYSGPKIWNEIPLSIRQAENITAFKKMYLSWKFSNARI